MNRLSLLGSCSIAIFCAVSPALGQTTDGQTGTAVPQADARPGADAATNEIVVTAQRRAERLQDVPITIQNLSGQTLKDANIQNIQEIGKVTSSLRFDNQGAFVQPTIRGIGTSVVTSGSGSNVGIYIDGFYSPNPIAADFDLLAVENIQVLKGPQGTLFGRNTTGGAILVTTAKPSHETSGVIDVSYGSFNAQRLQAYGTTSLTDKIAFDIGGEVSRGDGYIHNVVTHRKDDARFLNWQVRAGLKVDLNDDISVLFHYQHTRTDDPLSQLTSAYVSDGQPVYPAAVSGPTRSVGQPLSSSVFLPGAVFGTGPGQTSITDRVFVHANNDVFQLTPTFDLGFATLTSYTQYRDERSAQQQSGYNATPDALQIDVPIHDRTFSQELLLSSKPGGRLQWTAGAFYLDYRDRFKAFISPGGAPFFQIAGSHTDTRSTAVFVDATYQLLDKLFVTAGARYSHDEIRDPYYQVLGEDGLDKVFAPLLKNNRVTPRVVLRYAPDRNTSLYASYTQGYKAAIYNLGGQSIDAVKPERLNAYEVGFKHAERAFSVDLAGFYYDYKNLQVSSYGITAGGVPVGIVSNAANARIYGVDAQFRYNLTPDFQIDASGGYLNAKYKHYINDPGFAVCTPETVANGGLEGNPSAFTVCGGDVLVNAPIADGKGLTMQRSPKWTATVGARYGIDANGGRLVLSGNLYYTSRIYFDPADQFKQNGYATLGLRAEWTDPSKKITIAVYGDNVTNKRYYQVVTPENTSAVATWSPPATVGGEFRFRF